MILITVRGLRFHPRPEGRGLLAVPSALPLDKNLDYRRHRIEWRKGQPASWDMWRIKEEFFQMFCEKDLPVFQRDIEIFVNYYPDLPTGEIAKIFCGEFKGYEKMYGMEFVERAIRRCQNDVKN